MPARDDLTSESDRIVFEALWTGVVNAWERDDRHAKFLDHVRKTGTFTDAAARYGKLRDDPERGEEAKKRLSAIAILATSELFATRTPQEARKVPRWVWGLAVLVCLSLLGVSAWHYLGLGQPRPVPTRSVPSARK